MKIYDWYDGPYPARVRIALAEKGLLSDTEFVPVNLWTGENKKSEFLALNYSGTLPFLSWMTVRLSQSVRPSRIIWTLLSTTGKK